MHQTLEIYMMRKKRVPDFYNPDSNRIFDETVSDKSLGDSRLNKSYIERVKEPPPPHPRDPHRRHCPHPYYSRFLTANARTLNKPVSLIHIDDEDTHWWPSFVPKKETKLPPVTKDTTQRLDYVDHRPIKRQLQRSRDILSSANGILPVNPHKSEDEPGEHLLEKISFFHQYDSRAKELMRRRGKLHGCYVWDRVVKDTKGQDVIETAWNRGLLERERKMMVIPVTKNQANTPVESKTEENNVVQTTETKSHQIQNIPQESANNDEQVKEKTFTPQKRGSQSSIPPIEGLPPP